MPAEDAVSLLQPGGPLTVTPNQLALGPTVWSERNFTRKVRVRLPVVGVTSGRGEIRKRRCSQLRSRSALSAFTESVPPPQSTVSRRPFATSIASRPGPASTRLCPVSSGWAGGDPAPPSVIVCFPAPPTSLSGPAPPPRLSLPPWPRSTSAPSLPRR